MKIICLIIVIFCVSFFPILLAYYMFIPEKVNAYFIWNIFDYNIKHEDKIKRLSSKTKIKEKDIILLYYYYVKKDITKFNKHCNSNKKIEGFIRNKSHPSIS